MNKSTIFNLEPLDWALEILTFSQHCNKNKKRMVLGLLLYGQTQGMFGFSIVLSKFSSKTIFFFFFFFCLAIFLKAVRTDMNNTLFIVISTCLLSLLQSTETTISRNPTTHLQARRWWRLVTRLPIKEFWFHYLLTNTRRLFIFVIIANFSCLLAFYLIYKLNGNIKFTCFSF